MRRWSVAQFGSALYFYAAWREFPPSINSLRDIDEGWTFETAQEFCRYLNEREAHLEEIGRVLDARVQDGAIEATVQLSERGWRWFKLGALGTLSLVRGKR